MYPTLQYLRSACTLLVCACLTALTASTALAQPQSTLLRAFDRPVHLAVTGASMDSAIAAIAKETHLSIVADGEPLRKSADFSLDGTLRETLDKVADAFDYNWKLSRSGVVMMAKRFKDPNERPQTNLPEMLEMVRNMVRALNLVDYDKDPSRWPVLAKQVADSFTAEQLAVLNSGQRLRGSDLLPPQQQLLHQALLSGEFIPQLDRWEPMVQLLENGPGSRLQARKRDETAVAAGATPGFDYLYTYRSANGLLHVVELPALEHGEIVEPQGAP